MKIVASVLSFAFIATLVFLTFSSAPMAQERDVDLARIELVDVPGVTGSIEFTIPKGVEVRYLGPGRDTDHPLDDVKSILKIEYEGTAAEVVSYPVDFDMNPVDFLRFYLSVIGFEQLDADTMSNDRLTVAEVDYIVNLGDNVNEPLLAYSVSVNGMIFVILGADYNSNNLVNLLAATIRIPEADLSRNDVVKNVQLLDKSFELDESFFVSESTQDGRVGYIITDGSSLADSSILITVAESDNSSFSYSRDNFEATLVNLGFTFSEIWKNENEAAYDLVAQDNRRFSGKLYVNEFGTVTVVAPNAIEDPRASLKSLYYYTTIAQEILN